MEILIIILIVGFILYQLFRFFASSDKNVVKERELQKKEIVDLQNRNDKKIQRDAVVTDFHKAVTNLNNMIIRSSLMNSSRFDLNDYSLDYEMNGLYTLNFRYDDKFYSYNIGLKTEKKNSDNQYDKSLTGKIYVTPKSYLQEEIEELTKEYDIDGTFALLRDIEKSLMDENYRKQLRI